ENQQVVAGEPLFSYDATKVNAEYNKAVRSRDLIQNRLKIEQSELATMNKQLAAIKKKVKNGDEYTEEDVNVLAKEIVQIEMGLENTKDELTSSQELINELAETKKGMTVTSKIDGRIVKVNKNIERTEDGSMIPVVHIISSEP